MAYGAGDNPHAPKVRRRATPRAAPPPNFPTFVPAHPGQTPAEAATSVRKRASRVAVSAQRKRTGGDRPILVKRRQAKVVQQAPAAYYASLGPAVEHAATQQRRGLALGAPEDKPAVVVAVAHPAKTAGLLGKAITGAGKVAGAVVGSGFGGKPLADEVSKVLLGHDPKPEAGAAKFTHDIIRNAPLDAAELAVNTPTSLAHLGVTAATHPERLPGELAAPYVELYHHPGKFISTHPVTTALMLAPGVKVPGRVVGRAVRLAGKQTLERPAAELAGTTLKQARVGSRDVVVRAVQAKRDAKAGTPVMSAGEVARRVDEFHDAGRHYRQRVRASAAEQAKARGMSDEQAAEHLQGASIGAGQELDRRFGREFGSHWRVGENGVVYKPKGATEGHLHDSRTEAQAVADKVPFDASVVEAGPDKWAVVPEAAAERRAKHATVGTSPALGARALRVSSRSFRRTVLPTSARWIFGQAAEAGARSAAMGAGPLSYLRGARVIRRLEADAPGTGKALAARAVSGGMFARSSVAREFMGGQRTLAEDFEGASPRVERAAQAATKVGQAPGIRHVRKGWNEYSRIVFDTVNARIENTARTAMLGKAIKRSPLLEDHVIGLSDKAIQQAADGLHGTAEQVELGRAVDRAYGRYAKFGPDAREALTHFTPFAPWMANMTKFLLRVLPNDSPVKASLLASWDKADEEWRIKHHLSLRDPSHVPGYLLGQYPLSGNRFMPVGHFLPAAPGEPVSAVGGLVLPQVSGTLLALSPGVDWKGKRIGHGGLGQLGAAVRTTAEAHVPGLTVSERIAGVGVKRKGTRAQRIVRVINPLAPTQGKVTRKGSGGLAFKDDGLELKSQPGLTFKDKGLTLR